MTLDAKRGVLGRHPRAVVAHTEQTQAAFFDLDCDPIRTGIDGILDQLFDYAGRTFDDFACGDLVGQRVRQNTYAGRHAGHASKAAPYKQSRGQVRDPSRLVSTKPTAARTRNQLGYNSDTTQIRDVTAARVALEPRTLVDHRQFDL
jgi:hypothetical protein